MGRKDLVVKKSSLNVREVSLRTTLRKVRREGHVYVELRSIGKCSIFFCVLCLKQCFNETVLSDHLGGNRHARRVADASLTLFGPMPWPFNDGVLFFGLPSEEEQHFPVLDSQKNRSLGIRNDNSDEVVGSNSNVNASNSGGICNKALGKTVIGRRKSMKSDGRCLTIPGVLINEIVSNLRVSLIGYGNIAFRIHETNEGPSKISRIWCAWLGQGESDCNKDSLATAKSDFAIVKFAYSYGLGRKRSLNDPSPLNSPDSFSDVSEVTDVGSHRAKRVKSYSDPEDFSGSHVNLCGSSDSECAGVSMCIVEGSHQLNTSRLGHSKSARRELRKDKRSAAEKTCDICAQPMLIGKDVATLLNIKTGRIACSSRNTNGAFHLFHVSCLTHWILLCKSEIFANELTNTKPTRGRRGKVVLQKHITSVLCPECQGTGKYIKGDDLERPTIPPSQMFRHKLNAILAQKSWMKNPEILQKCSTGLHFPSGLEENPQENVTPVELLCFYQADS